MSGDPTSVGEILDAVGELAEGAPRVGLSDVVERMGERSYGPFLMVPALIEMSPIGGIPGLPTVIAAVIILFAVQMALGRTHIWLPGLLERRSISADRARKAVAAMRGTAGFMDRWFHGRLPALTGGPFVRVAGVGSILLALTVPPLELIPFASTAPMAAIAAFGLALLVRDGALMILAILLSGVAVAIGVGVLVGG